MPFCSLWLVAALLRGGIGDDFFVSNFLFFLLGLSSFVASLHITRPAGDTPSFRNRFPRDKAPDICTFRLGMFFRSTISL